MLATHTHTCTNKQTTVLCLCGLSGTTWVSRYQKKHSPTHTYQFTCLTIFFHKSLSKFSLVYLLACHPQLHTPYIFSPNHCLLFTVHVHTVTTCFAAVLRLCHLILVSLSTVLGILSCSLMPQIHLTILISAR